MNNKFSDLSWLGNAKNDVIKIVGIRAVCQKNLSDADFEGVNLSDVDFTGVAIIGANLKNTNAKIDPQKVWGRTLRDGNFEGLDFSEASFTGVIIDGANLKNSLQNLL